MLEATHYASIAQAVSATPDGGTLYIAAGEHPLPAGGLELERPIQLIGDGPGTLLWTAADSPGIVIRAGLTGVRLADLQVKSARPAPRHGIAVLAKAGQKTVHLRFERVTVAAGGADGFHFEGFDLGEGSLVHVTLTDCAAIENQGAGLFLKNAAMVRVEGGQYGGNGRHGIFAWSCPAVRIWGPGLEDNQRRGTDPIYDAQLRLKLCHGFSVLGLHVEEFARNKVCRTGVCVEACQAGSIGSGLFGNAVLTAGARGVLAVDSTALEVGALHTSNLDVFAEFQRCEKVTLGRQGAHGAEGRVLGLPAGP